MTRPLHREGFRRPIAAYPYPGNPYPGATAKSVLFEGDFDVGFDRPSAGAPHRAEPITTEARGAALQLAGQLLREAVLG